MTDDDLIGLEHENWIAYLTGVVSCTSRANVTRAGGVVTILTALPFDWLKPDPGSTRGGDTGRRPRRGGQDARAR